MSSRLFFAVFGPLVLIAFRAGARYSAVIPSERAGVRAPHRLSGTPPAWGPSGSLAVTCLLALASELMFPAYEMYGSWAALLPFAFVIVVAEAFHDAQHAIPVPGSVPDVIAIRRPS